MRYAVPGLPLSVTLTGVCGGVDLTSPSIKRHLGYGFFLLDYITNAILVILVTSCKFYFA